MVGITIHLLNIYENFLALKKDVYTPSLTMNTKLTFDVFDLLKVLILASIFNSCATQTNMKISLQRVIECRDVHSARTKEKYNLEAIVSHVKQEAKGWVN